MSRGQTYQEMTETPWGRMFYRLALAQIPQYPPGGVIDFGSGLGITASHLAEKRAVIAIEPDADMIAHAIHDNSYLQRRGGAELLNEYQGEAALVVCHNVLGYLENPREAFGKLAACLKRRGVLSIILINKKGFALQRAVFAADPADALRIYRGGELRAETMGQNVSEINKEDLLAWAKENGLAFEALRGIRSAYGLGGNDKKTDPKWSEGMFSFERAVESDPVFLGIAFYHHWIFRRVDQPA